jgi:tRNA (guanine-N7-)-methyltransferase
VGKGKLQKFEEMKTFNNVIQPPFKDIFQGDFHLKNKWAEGYFSNDHPLILELGCGKGEYTLGLARIHPCKNFIGIDVKGARIWNGAKQALEEGLTNVAFIRSRIEFIDSFFGRDEVEEIWLTFPDPQQKKRRIKKRLTASCFLNKYRNFLRDNGRIHLKTDNSILYHYTMNMVKYNKLPLLFATQDLYDDHVEEFALGIQTYYEKQFVAENLPIHYMEFRLPSGKPIREPDDDFYKRVYLLVRQVPAGRVTTYGAIARFLGSPQSARMVGWAMNNSHTREEYVPAHRVVNRTGQLTGKHHFGGPRVMQELLESEGIRIVDDQIIDFSRLLWDPSQELI